MAMTPLLSRDSLVSFDVCERDIYHPSGGTDHGVKIGVLGVPRDPVTPETPQAGPMCVPFGKILV